MKCFVDVGLLFLYMIKMGCVCNGSGVGRVVRRWQMFDETVSGKWSVECWLWSQVGWLDLTWYVVIYGVDVVDDCLFVDVDMTMSVIWLSNRNMICLLCEMQAMSRRNEMQTCEKNGNERWEEKIDKLRVNGRWVFCEQAMSHKLHDEGRMIGGDEDVEHTMMMWLDGVDCNDVDKTA